MENTVFFTHDEAVMPPPHYSDFNPASVTLKTCDPLWSSGWLSSWDVGSGKLWSLCEKLKICQLRSLSSLLLTTLCGLACWHDCCVMSQQLLFTPRSQGLNDFCNTLEQNYSILKQSKETREARNTLQQMLAMTRKSLSRGQLIMLFNGCV